MWISLKLILILGGYESFLLSKMSCIVSVIVKLMLYERNKKQSMFLNFDVDWKFIVMFGI